MYTIWDYLLTFIAGNCKCTSWLRPCLEQLFTKTKFVFCIWRDSPPPILSPNLGFRKVHNIQVYMAKKNLSLVKLSKLTRLFEEQGQKFKNNY